MRNFLVLAFVTLGAGQISFDSKPKNDAKSFPKDDKSSSSFSNVFKNPLTSKHKISFGPNPPPKNININSKPFSLAKLLNKETPELQTRFGFSSKPSSRLGQGCVTPLSEAGTCQFISSGDCRPVLEAIIRHGVTRSLLRYLLAAIRSPCGFEGSDISLCCASRTTSTTLAPTTTTSTTTTSGPTSSSTTSATTTTTTTTTSTTTTPAPVTCGVSSVVASRVVSGTMRIVGGEVARVGAWPWTALLGRTGLSGGISVVCGGSLIAPDTVLTAAHCFEGSSRDPRVVRLGEHDISTLGETRQPALDIDIAGVTKHPAWDPATLANDIAIVKLVTNVSLTPSISPVCLPDDYTDAALPSLLQDLHPVVVGWGATRTFGPAQTVLHQASVPMVSGDKCSAAYSGVNVEIGDSQVCAGVGGTDTCNGDSGGPLLADKLGNRWSVVGITSFGVECGRPEFPGVYTRVDRYLTWIRDSL